MHEHEYDIHDLLAETVMSDEDLNLDFGHDELYESYDDELTDIEDDEELARDMILERQELEDYEGLSFHDYTDAYCNDQF
jgi:hypothetical protein